MCFGRRDKREDKRGDKREDGGAAYRWLPEQGDVKAGQAPKPSPVPEGHCSMPQRLDPVAPRPPPAAGPAPAYDWAAPPRDAPPPLHDWQAAVPDTALFPPPPPFFGAHDRSHTTNASEAEAEAGEAWCRQYPLATPLVLDDAGRAALRSRNIRLMEPAGFDGRLDWLAQGHWRVQTNRDGADSCIIGYPPLYLADSRNSPSAKAKAAAPTTVYYEVKLLAGSRHNSVALGFTALPYPGFRMPGWHRGSLAVHGDDGHRFVNDRWGGKDFTAEFRRGDTYGLGMTLAPDGGVGAPRVNIFMTRNGARVGGWDLHEETDAEGDLPVTGLEGFHDLTCAVGTYDGVSVEVILDPAKWMYRGAEVVEC